MGLAAANAIGQLSGGTMNFHALFRGNSRLRLTLSGYRVDGALLWRLTKLGAPASITQMERAVSQLVLVGFVTFFGDYALAAYSLTRRTEMFVNMGSWGIGNSAGTLVGQNLGAGKPERAKAAVLWATGYVAVAKAFLGGLLFAFPALFISVFNEDPELLPLAVTWLRIQVIGYLAMGMTQVIMQSIQTAGDMIFPMIVTLVCVWGIEVPLSFILSQHTELGQFGVAWAIVIGLTVRLVIFIPYFLSMRWSRKALLEGLPQRGSGAAMMMGGGGGGH
jgi:Na+-driven multidrug efflux pump